MKQLITVFMVGFLFAVGLAVSGMTQPAKVVGFLDIFDTWDPSLIFVMIGAIAVHLVGYQIKKRRTQPLFDHHWHVPTKNEITPMLILGSVLFGIGWGLAGFCPGPAIASLGTGSNTILVFLVSMIAGMGLFHALDSRYHFKR